MLIKPGWSKAARQEGGYSSPKNRKKYGRFDYKAYDSIAPRSRAWEAKPKQ
jgi:hypothetical protein